MSKRSIGETEGPDGNRIATLRHDSKKLDSALEEPVSSIMSKNHRTDVKIAEQLSENFGWERHNIRDALRNKHHRGGQSFEMDDGYVDSVLKGAGLKQEDIEVN